MAKSETIKAKDWGRITADCRKAVKISLGFELAHVGLNHDSEEKALAGANALNALFGLGVKDGTASCFYGAFKMYFPGSLSRGIKFIIWWGCCLPW